MSEYRYNLSITGAEHSEVASALAELKEKEVIPYLVDIDYFGSKPSNGLFRADLSTELVSRDGTVSCWFPKDHEEVLHTLSKAHPGIMVELVGEDVDSPNNYVFKKAFQNGLYKEAELEKQDISEAFGKSTWRLYGEPALEGKEAEVFAMYENIASMRTNPNYAIAYDMAYLMDMAEPNEHLSERDVYILASKLNEASASWLNSGALHEEYLDAIRYMVENGLKEAHSPELPELGPEDTLKLLLSADDQVFGTLVEAVTMDNQYCYNEGGYVAEEDLDAVNQAINKFKNVKQSLSEKIAGAEAKAAGQQAEQGKDPLSSVR